MQTRASRKAVASLPTPELYLKLTSLEIERSRRANELEYILERLSSLQNRIRAIVEEQDILQSRIDAQQGTLPTTISSSFSVNPTGGFTY